MGFAIAIVLSVFILLYLYRDQLSGLIRRRPPPRHLHHVKKAPPFRSVSIVSNAPRCKTAIRVKDERFLAVEAPPLPLPGCTSENCHCRYHYHDDRRSELNRRAPAGSIQRDFVASENFKERKGADRRHGPEQSFG